MVCTLVIVCWVWKPFFGRFSLVALYLLLFTDWFGRFFFKTYLFILNGPEDSFFAGLVFCLIFLLGGLSLLMLRVFCVALEIDRWFSILLFRIRGPGESHDISLKFAVFFLVAFSDSGRAGFFLNCFNRKMYYSSLFINSDSLLWGN